MISQTIRNWTKNHKFSTNILLYQYTPVGLFKITDVDTQVRTNLEAIEQLILALTKSMSKITRIEVSVVSGLEISMIEPTLDKLTKNQLIKLSEFDGSILNQNMERLRGEFGNEWENPKTKRILDRQYIKQFEITPTGENALATNKKSVSEILDLELVLTGKPFSVYQGSVGLQQEGYDKIQMTPQLVSQVLNLTASNKSADHIIPKQINMQTVSEGKEVTNAQYWVAMEPKDKKLSFEKSRYNVFLTSRSFDRWINPQWNSELIDELPDYDNIHDLVVDAISETFNMVKSVIRDGLTLSRDKVTWVFECDLEMLLLISKSSPELIAETRTEVSLDIPNCDWKLTMIIELRAIEEEDDLSKIALESGRFHARSSRRGFNRDSGFEVWQRMNNELSQNTKISDYKANLSHLVKYKCLVEIIPEIDNLVVDVEDLMKHNRRDSQQWLFNRLRITKKLLEELNTKVTYVTPNILVGKIDEADEYQQWSKENDIEIFDLGDKSSIHPAIKRAAASKAYYVGNRKIPKGDKFKSLRIHGRQLNFTLDKNIIKIPKIEPFYEWRMESIFEKLYSEYYD